MSSRRQQARSQVTRSSSAVPHKKARIRSGEEKYQVLKSRSKATRSSSQVPSQHNQKVENNNLFLTESSSTKLQRSDITRSVSGRSRKKRNTRTIRLSSHSDSKVTEDSYERKVDTLPLTHKLKVLGRGSFGTVSLWKAAKQLYVVKEIQNRGKTRDKFLLEILNEVAILSHLKSECSRYFVCLHSYNIFAPQLSNNFLASLTYPYVENSFTLSGFLEKNKLNPYQILYVMQNLAWGLRKLHELKVAHRDIKPDNILIVPHQLSCRYLDFGLSCIDPYVVNRIPLDNFHNIADRTLVANHSALCWNKTRGSPYYMGPEVFQRNVERKDNFPLDVYALGISYLEMIAYRYVPIHAIKREVQRWKQASLPDILRNPEIPREDYKWFSQVYSIIKPMIHPDPTQRITASDTAARLNRLVVTFQRPGYTVKQTRSQLGEKIKIHPGTSYYPQHLVAISEKKRRTQ